MRRSELEQLDDKLENRLNELRDIELKLNSSQVQLFWENADESQRIEFFEQRRGIVILRSKLEPTFRRHLKRR